MKIAFHLVQELGNIFNTSTSIEVTYTKLAHWYNDVEKTGFKTFNTIVNTITITDQSLIILLTEVQMPPRNPLMQK